MDFEQDLEILDALPQYETYRQDIKTLKKFFVNANYFLNNYISLETEKYQGCIQFFNQNREIVKQICSNTIFPNQYAFTNTFIRCKYIDDIYDRIQIIEILTQIDLLMQNLTQQLNQLNTILQNIQLLDIDFNEFKQQLIVCTNLLSEINTNIQNIQQSIYYNDYIDTVLDKEISVIKFQSELNKIEEIDNSITSYIIDINNRYSQENLDNINNLRKNITEISKIKNKTIDNQFELYTSVDDIFQNNKNILQQINLIITTNNLSLNELNQITASKLYESSQKDFNVTLIDSYKYRLDSLTKLNNYWILDASTNINAIKLSASNFINSDIKKFCLTQDNVNNINMLLKNNIYDNVNINITDINYLISIIDNLDTIKTDFNNNIKKLNLNFDITNRIDNINLYLKNQLYYNILTENTKQCLNKTVELLQLMINKINEYSDENINSLREDITKQINIILSDIICDTELINNIIAKYQEYDLKTSNIYQLLVYYKDIQEEVKSFIYEIKNININNLDLTISTIDDNNINLNDNNQVCYNNLKQQLVLLNQKIKYYSYENIPNIQQQIKNRLTYIYRILRKISDDYKFNDLITQVPINYENIDSLPLLNQYLNLLTDTKVQDSKLILQNTNDAYYINDNTLALFNSLSISGTKLEFYIRQFIKYYNFYSDANIADLINRIQTRITQIEFINSLNNKSNTTLVNTNPTNNPYYQYITSNNIATNLDNNMRTGFIYQNTFQNNQFVNETTVSNTVVIQNNFDRSIQVQYSNVNYNFNFNYLNYHDTNPDVDRVTRNRHIFRSNASMIYKYIINNINYLNTRRTLNDNYNDIVIVDGVNVSQNTSLYKFLYQYIRKDANKVDNQIYTLLRENRVDGIRISDHIIDLYEDSFEFNRYYNEVLITPQNKSQFTNFVITDLLPLVYNLDNTRLYIIIYVGDSLQITRYKNCILVRSPCKYYNGNANTRCHNPPLSKNESDDLLLSYLVYELKLNIVNTVSTFTGDDFKWVTFTQPANQANNLNNATGGNIKRRADIVKNLYLQRMYLRFNYAENTVVFRQSNFENNHEHLHKIKIFKTYNSEVDNNELY